MQVRKYSPFIVVESKGDKLSGSAGFNDLAGYDICCDLYVFLLPFSLQYAKLIPFYRYIFGKNSTSEKIPMTTPVFTEAFDDEISKVSIQIVLPLEKDIKRWSYSVYLFIFNKFLLSFITILIYFCFLWTYVCICTLSRLPDPNQEGISLREVEEDIIAVSKFSGKPTEDVVCEKEKQLRSNLIKDGLKPKMGCLLARYNDPGRTWSFTMVWLSSSFN